MIKGFRQIAFLTTLSRVLGMVRDMSFAFFLGATSISDGWVIAFMIPNLARRLFGEGAASSSVIPVYSEELQKDAQKARKLASTVVTVVFVLLVGIVIFGEGIVWAYHKFFSSYASTDLKLELTGIMLPYMILICMVAILAGILNTHRHFASPAAAPIVLNIFLIGTLFFTGWVLKIEPRQQVFYVAGAVLIAGVVQVFMQLVPLWSRGIYLRPTWQVHSEAFKKIMVLMGPMILGLTATQINTLFDTLIANWFSSSIEKGQFFYLLGKQIQYPMLEGAATRLFYSQRLYQFPLGVLGISLATAIFPVMSSDAARKDMTALSKTISRGLRGCVFVAIPATAGLLLIAGPLVSVIFERGKFTGGDSALTSGILCFYALGLCGFFTQQIVTRAFYSMQDSKMPAKSAIFAVCCNIILNLTLIWFLGAAGLALSTAVCSYLQVVILVSVLQRRLGKSIFDGLAKTLFKTIVCTVFMTAAILAVLQMVKTQADLVQLAAVLPVGAGVYALTAKISGAEMLGLLTGKRKEIIIK